MTGANGDTPALREWIAAREPPVPGGFARWMRPRRPAAPASVESLVREARDALDRALDGRDRPRRGAFDLLAADGFATWACEAALARPEPEAALARVLDDLLA